MYTMEIYIYRGDIYVHRGDIYVSPSSTKTETERRSKKVRYICRKMDD